MSAQQEVERKWLLDGVPDDVRAVPGDVLRQGYLALDGDTEVRLRFEAGGARLTIKHGSGLVRVEETMELDDRQAASLWLLTEGRRVEKRRRRVPHGVWVVEVDEYEGDLAGLLVAEVEFPDPGAARAYAPPPWFGAEVTEDPRFKNRRLAVDGRPARED